MGASWSGDPDQHLFYCTCALYLHLSAVDWIPQSTCLDWCLCFCRPYITVWGCVVSNGHVMLQKFSTGVQLCDICFRLGLLKYFSWHFCLNTRQGRRCSEKSEWKAEIGNEITAYVSFLVSAESEQHIVRKTIENNNILSLFLPVLSGGQLSIYRNNLCHIISLPQGNF